MSARWAAMALALAVLAGPAAAADSTYPFFGSWVRSDRTCSASAARERIYTPRDVTSPRGKCVVRKIVAGSGGNYEIFERCERPNERSSTISELIRMTGTDSMVVTRRTARLKLSRSLRFTRCPTPPSTLRPVH